MIKLQYYVQAFSLSVSLSLTLAQIDFRNWELKFFDETVFVFEISGYQFQIVITGKLSFFN